MIVEGREEEYDYVEDHGPGYVRNSGDGGALFQVGTTYVPIGSVLEIHTAEVYRKKLDGGTVTSVKLQGRMTSNQSWSDLQTMADDTKHSVDVHLYKDFRLEVIIATNPVLLDWMTIFDTVSIKTV